MEPQTILRSGDGRAPRRPARPGPIGSLTRIIREWRPPFADEHGPAPSVAVDRALESAILQAENRAVVSPERLAAFAQRLAAQHTVTRNPRTGRSLRRRLDAAARFLAAVHATLQEQPTGAGTTRPAGADKFLLGAEWLLDNYYVIADQIAEVRIDLPVRYYSELAKLTAGPLAGYPRVYALARALVAYTDGALNGERITAFVAAYQAAVPARAPLTLGELWSVPIMLRLSLVETLAHLLSLGRRLRAQAETADAWADRLLAQADAHPGQPVPVPAELAAAPIAAEPAFAARFYARIRDQGIALAPVLDWLAGRLAAAGSTPDETQRRDQRQQAALVASIGNAVSSMRRITAIDWPAFVESLSLIETRLRQDPAGVYAGMDFATRDRYRHVVERLARRAGRHEGAVAAAVVATARQAAAAAPADRRAHLGYYLIGPGRAALEATLDYRPAPLEGAARLVQAHALPFYLGLLAGTTAAGMAGAVALARRHGGKGAGLLGTAAVAALPASQFAVSLVNHLLTTVLEPYVLPKLELKAGIPATARTFVVIPVLLTGAGEVRELLNHLQVLYLANHDPHLHYALITDFPDAATEEEPGDADLLHQAVTGIEDLNRLYGGDDRFYLFHRRRCWNPGERTWMGWERKRGKLLEFNRLLRGRGGADFTVRVGDQAILPEVKYVISLDADTQLPAGAARRLIGTLAHPLNGAVLNADRRVVEGYGLLQPRVAVTATSAAASLFARIAAGHTGIDPYTTAISDIYQDLFRSAIYIGKGIYDVDAFEAAVGERFPENTLLSHDLIEGAYARAGLVSDIAFYEDQPARYPVAARRQDRWLRGDWQILEWLLPRVPAADGGRVRNPLPALARWQIFDNLRRSLEPIGGLAFFLAGWTVLPGPAAAWTAAGLLVRAFPLVSGLLGSVVRKPPGTPWGRHLRFLAHESAINAAQTALTTTLLPQQTYLHARAIGRALLRMYITHRQLLQWQTAAAAERTIDNRLPAFAGRMWPGWAIGFGGWAGGELLAAARRDAAPGAPAPAALVPPPSAWPILLAWAAAPVVAWWVSQPTRRTFRALRPDEHAFLRQIARQTWRYFEEFVGPADGWLAPDNYQEVPQGTLARRTSPTNLSLSLLATLTARDFGHLSPGATAGRLEQQLAGMDRLERFRGHFYNWYDTATGAPLTPRYISTVDSGNLAAHLLVLKQGVLALADAPLLGPETLTGLADTAGLLREAARQAGAGPELTAALDAFAATLATPPADLPAWTACIGALAAGAAAIAGLVDPAAAADLRYWAGALAAEAGAYQEDVASLLGWVTRLATPPPGVSFLLDELLDGEGPDAAQAALRTIPSPTGNLTWCARRLPAVRRARSAIRQADLDPATRDAALTWLEGVHESILAAWTASETLARRLREIAGRAAALSADMRFEFLLDPARKLFVIGYNVEEGRPDGSHYDLLASEARLGSYLAVARGDAPAEHWFHLGRGLAPAQGSQALISWTGTMFEYLMPNLVMPVYAGTLLDQTGLAVVRRQQEYGRERGVPWGISEAAYNVVDAGHNYQYRAFGVPGLGLKRGLEDDLVIAPYATLLALSVDPPAALANLRRLAAAGLRGRYGFYESIDYTPGRTTPALVEPDAAARPRGRWPKLLPAPAPAAASGEDAPARRAGHNGAVVRTYMVHHQGMSLLAIANALHGYALPARFLAEPMIRSFDLLLQERIPRQTPLIQTERGSEHGGRVRGLPAEPERAGDELIPFETPFTPQPLAHLLSNGTYMVMLTNAGGGYSAWRKDAGSAPILVTRWRDDATREGGGTFCYLRDVRSGQVWSAGFAPTGVLPEFYGGEWTPDHGVIWRRDAGIETATTVVVSPDEDVEVRRLILTNHSTRAREIEITSYAEVVLAAAGADLAHPAFQKLFVETEWVPERAALLATRRPRAAHETPPWLFHTLAEEGDVRGSLEYETDRARFLGRGRSVAAPHALAGAEPLSGSTGAVLDPIVSLRRRVRLAPGENVRFTFATGVADTREEALALAERYQDAAGGSRALRLAADYSRIALAQRDLTPAAAMRAIRLAGHILFPTPALRPPAEVLARNTEGQPGLWALGISGDLPLVLLVIGDPRETPLLQEVVQAHDYLRALGLAFDLVVLNEYGEGYAQPVHDELRATLERGPDSANLDCPGGAYLRRADSLTEADGILLRTAARAVLLGRRGGLARQLARAMQDSSAPQGAGRGAQAAARKLIAGAATHSRAPKITHLVPLAAEPAGGVQPPLGPPTGAPAGAAGAPAAGLLFGNGLGGFRKDGREYVIHLRAGEWTPAPWTNVLATADFGCLVSESTIGSTWSLNSRENRLTPWSNDPVSDPPGDVVYLRDETTGAVWTPTPLPIRETAPYTIRHGQGYTVYSHTSHGLQQELTVWIPPDAPLRVARLTVRNTGATPRRLTVTNYVEWVLGVDRDPSARYVITGWDPAAGAVTARNPYNNEFAGGLAFLAAAGGPGAGRPSYTASRAAFLGRLGSPAAPAALLARTPLDGQAGAGLDPCAAIQVPLTLPPGGTASVAFLLGETAPQPGQSAHEAMHALLARFRAPAATPGAASAVETSLTAAGALWDDLLTRVQVQTPDPALDLLLNRWLLYQALACRIWARSAFYQGGGAYGFRDQLQDVLALVHAAPELTRAQILRAAARQFKEGDVQHWWHPPTGRGVRTRISDDLIWLPFVTALYVEASGDSAILDESLPFLEAPLLAPGQEDAYSTPAVSAESAPLYEHCVRALLHGDTQGAHGLPLMGTGDWNDGMNRVGGEGRGESVWLGWFLAATLARFAPLAAARGDTERAAWCQAEFARLGTAIEAAAWDGAWYRRAYFDDGAPLGSHENVECRIDSIAQSWAVLSGAGDPAHAREAMAALAEHLVRPDAGLALLLTPPFDKAPLDPGYIKGYVPGIRENGGQYTHAATWVGFARAALGDGAGAHALFAMLNPLAHSADPAGRERYKVEPYVIAADVYAHPDHLGRGGWTWYTGSAAWFYRLGVEAILGLHREGAALRLDPAIPPAWPGYTITYRFGPATVYHITVDNSAGSGHGVAAVTLDGIPLPDGRIPLDATPGTHQVSIRLGPPAPPAAAPL